MFAACGLDESGTAPSDASIQPDIVVDNFVLDTYVETAPPPPPLSCEEAGIALDASCLGVPVPDGGWQPIGIQNGNAGCGTGTYSVQLVQGNIQLAGGACGCTGCTPSGSWTCNNAIGTGAACGTTTTANGNACLPVSANAFNETLTRTGNGSCAGGQENGNGQSTETAMTMCFPQSCSDDYCGLAKLGFQLCVYNPNVTDGSCPANFPTSHIVGQAPVVVCNACNACTVQSPPACTGTVVAYDEAGCTGNVLASNTSSVCVSLGEMDAGADADADAAPVPITFQSLYFEAGAAAPVQCNAVTNVTDGSIVVNGAWTVCCN